VASNAGDGITAPNTAMTLSAAILLAYAGDSDGDTLTLTGVSNPTNGTVTFNTQNNTVTFTPTSSYTGPASFTYSVSDGHGNSASAQASLEVANSLWGNSSAPAVASQNDAHAVELGVKFTASSPATVTGIRFYKGPQNTGLHQVDLWSNTGTLIASATATNETASGWQEADFSSPVTITPNTTYIAAYHTNTGFYSADAGYFNNTLTNGPLTAPSSVSSGGNGVYVYSASDAFPTDTYNAANYWVDVALGPPVQTAPVAHNAGDFITAPNTVMTLSAATLLAFAGDSDGDTLALTGMSSPTNGAVTFNTQNNTVTFTPTSGYTGPASFTYSVSDGHGNSASAQVSLEVANSLWSNANTPNVVSQNDAGAIELGTKFTANSPATIYGIRFYKGPQNTGTHQVDLWSNTGTLLASATATNETASGWQEADFSSPVTITPNTTYIAAYHTNTGFYSADAGYFNNALTNGALTVPSSASSGGNGVYVYSAGDAFPTNTFNATNYWVDVALGPPIETPPVASNYGNFITAPNTAMTLSAATLLANDSDPDGDTLSVTGVSNPVHGTVSFNAQNNTATFTPTSGYTGPASFTYSISDGHGNNASGQVSLEVANSLWGNSDAPTVISANDASAVELGVKFTANTPGTITGIRFYKGPQNSGTHIGDLWSTSGNLLATTTFTNETASGWQEADFSNPVAVTAGTTYVASYHTDAGNYSADGNYFATAYTNINGTLTAPSGSSGGGNGVYAYGSSSLFPSNSYNASNYWVDVVFTA
jgi:hypothetical protein